jgi:hypothetical protein
VNLGELALVGLVAFKESQAWAVRSARKLVARGQDFVGLAPEPPPKPKDGGPHDFI